MNISQKEPSYNIVIDKSHYKVNSDNLTGMQIKTIGSVISGYELWQEVPGKNDLLLLDDTIVEIKSGMRFFSTKSTIDPGEKKYGIV